MTFPSLSELVEHNKARIRLLATSLLSDLAEHGEEPLRIIYSPLNLHTKASFVKRGG